MTPHPGPRRSRRQNLRRVPRTVARVNGKGEINTTTALTDFANENNPRGATSSDGTKIWVGGAGKTNNRRCPLHDAGFLDIESPSTPPTRTYDRSRSPNGQLYTSADPTKNILVTVRDGGQRAADHGKARRSPNLPFTTRAQRAVRVQPADARPGPDPRHDLRRRQRSWRQSSSTGSSDGKVGPGGIRRSPLRHADVTANDVSGVVTIYATSSGSEGYAQGPSTRSSDVSGAGGTLSGIPVEIATAPVERGLPRRGVRARDDDRLGRHAAAGPRPSTPQKTRCPPRSGDPTNKTIAFTVERHCCVARRTDGESAGPRTTAVAPARRHQRQRHRRRAGR